MIFSRRKRKIRTVGVALMLTSVASACATDIRVGFPEATPQPTPIEQSDSGDPTPSAAPTPAPTPKPEEAFGQARDIALARLDDAPSITMHNQTAMTLGGVTDLGVTLSSSVDRSAGIAGYTIEFSGADWATTLQGDAPFDLEPASGFDPDETTVSYVIDTERTAYFRLDPTPPDTDPARPWTSVTAEQQEGTPKVWART
jgi:hypothetical protein